MIEADAAKCGEFEGQGRCRGLKVEKNRVPIGLSIGGHFLFTCSDTFVIECIVQPQSIFHHTSLVLPPSLSLSSAVASLFTFLYKYK